MDNENNIWIKVLVDLLNGKNTAYGNILNIMMQYLLALNWWSPQPVV